jgi:hypothetical protein
VSDIELNKGSGDLSSANDEVSADGQIAAADAPARVEREGLPRGYRMRADAHYVEQLVVRAAGQPVRMVPTDDVDAAGSFRPIDLESLVQSIRAHGVVHPLLVRRATSRYSVIAGRKRLAAARMVGMVTVPCLVHQVDDKEADLLARADNLVVAHTDLDADDHGMDSAVRRTVAHHLTTVQAAVEMAANGGGSGMARAALDLIKAHAWRAARLLDALELIKDAPVPHGRLRSISAIVEAVVEGFGAESRVTGVVVQAHFADGVPPITLNEHDVLAGLSGAVLAIVPLVEYADRPTIGIKLSSAASAAIRIDVVQTGVRVTSPANRFFDPASSDRPGGWCAVAGAIAAKAMAQRYGGSAAFEATSNGGSGVRILIPRRS